MDAHAEEASARRLVDDVSSGATAVIVSDAGMPGVSDPGSGAVALAAAAGLAVEVVPGPTAAATTLAVSGLPASQFRFAGFLPRKGAERRRALVAISADVATTVIYEAPSRVAVTVDDLCSACGPGRPLVAARELTKLHEEVWRGTLGGAQLWLEAVGEPRGEWVLVLGGADRREVPEAAVEDIESALLALADDGVTGRAAVAAVASELSVPKRRVYDVALALKSARGSPGSSGSPVSD